VRFYTFWAEMRLEEERLRHNIDAEAQRNNQLSNEISNQVKQDLCTELSEQRDNNFEALLRKVDDLSSKYSKDSQADSTAGKLGGASIDPDFSLTNTPDVIRVEPLNAASLMDKLGNTVSGLKDKAINALPNTDGSLLHGIGDNSIIKSHLPSSGGSAGINPADLPEPAYTLPRNSTLVGSTGMTALIGRIPIKGNVDDPYPFKVIVGRTTWPPMALKSPALTA
jgi:hypothetical protein